MRAVGDVEVLMLGPLEVACGGVQVPLGAQGQRALLARLLLDANRVVAMQRLVEDLWGEEAPPTAPKMVQVYVSRLRKLLPAGVLVTHSPGYAVHIEPQALDRERCQQLRERGQSALAAGAPGRAAAYLRDALALWRGPALAEFDEPFAALEARRLDELRLGCVEDRIEAELACGAHAELVGELDSLVAHDPLRERPWGQLMLALYRCGRQADALARYRWLRQLLSGELGIEPSPALRELERRMLQQDPTLDHVAPDSRPRRSIAIPRFPRAANPLTGTGWMGTRASRRGRCTAARAA
jgi:DNA-binding SARP family transcriptional activator